MWYPPIEADITPNKNSNLYEFPVELQQTYHNLPPDLVQIGHKISKRMLESVEQGYTSMTLLGIQVSSENENLLSLKIK